MSARTIQPQGGCTGSGLYVFRKHAVLCGSITVRVCAIARYKLYCNDVFLCEGPCQGSLHDDYYEEVDITPYIKQRQENELRAEVMHIAENIFTTVRIHEKPVFWLEGVQDGKTVLQTDKTWSVSRVDGVELVEGEGIMFSVPPFERHAARKQEIQLEVEEGKEVSADKVCTSTVGILGLLHLKKSPLPQMEVGEPRRMQKTKALDNGWVLDAGAYTTAKVRVQVKGRPGDVLTLRYAECYIQSGGLWNAKKGLRDDESGMLLGPCDTIELTGETQCVEFYWYRSFRYIELTCGHAKDLEAEVIYRPTSYPFAVTGTFECSDERYNKLWEISLRTLRACAHEILVDCPFFEQQQYVMDGSLQVLYGWKISSDMRMARKFLTEMAQSQLPEGLLCANYPSRYVQIIPTFSVYWLMLLREYCDRSHDLAFVQQQMGTVMKLLCAFDGMLDENGLIRSTYWPFVDWAGDWYNGVPNGGWEDPIAVCSMQVAHGLRCAELLASEVGEHALAQSYAGKRQALQASIRTHFWDADKLYYKDTLNRSEYSEHTAVWAILSEMETGESARALLLRMPELSTASCSFSMSFFKNRAYEKVGITSELHNGFSRFFDMMDQHCTTWCESPDDPRSECHGWSALPLYELSTGVLGVKPLKSDFTQVEISPVPGPLTYAKGTVPTPFGDLTVQWTKEDEEIHVSYLAPKEITVKLHDPNKH